MSNVVNLNRFRKKKVQAEKEERAAENRAKYGRTKDEKVRDKMETAQARKHLDDHQKETPE
ncbi:MAG: DUF4169 family protein [Pseudomonadota bacterium]